MKQHFSIYLHTNKVNGKKYVGQTMNTIECRWKDHVRDAKRNKGCKVFGAAIRKYGAGAFTHELLDVVTTQAGADIAETRWIEQRQSRVPNGYNIASGGGGKGRHHEISKRLMSASHKKIWQLLTPEERSARMRIMRSHITKKTTEYYSKSFKKVWASLTPEAHSNFVLKLKEARLAAKANMTPEEVSRFEIVRCRSIKDGKRRANELRVATTRRTNLVRINLLPLARIGRPLNPILTPEAINRARSMYVAGVSVRKIAIELRVNRTSVSLVLGLKNGRKKSSGKRRIVRRALPTQAWSPRHPNITPEGIERAHTMRAAGLALRVIATDIGVSITTLCRILNRSRS